MITLLDNPTMRLDNAGGAPPWTAAAPCSALQPATTRRWAPLPVLGRAPEMLLLSSIGVLLVALAYARARAMQPYAPALYWVGQVVVFAPVALRFLARRLVGVSEPFILVLGLAVNQYLLKWMYSPDQLRFPDELQHWASTTTLVQTGQLFHRNPALPASVHFPGLEEMGAAVVALTGLSVTNAGLLVAGVAHLVAVGALFMLALRAGASPAVAGLGCVVYATGLHYLFFDSMYLYQTAALPFLLLAVWAIRAWHPADRTTIGYLLIGLVSIAVTIVSHHVTAMILVGTLALIGACEVLLGPRRASRLGRRSPGKPYPLRRWRRRRRWAGVGVAAIAALGVVAWILLVAPEVVGYLGGPILGLSTAASRLVAGGGSAGGPVAASSPLWQVAIQAAGLVVLLGLWSMRAVAFLRGRRSAWRLALLVGGVAFFGASCLRFLGTQGPELAGRAATFTLLPMAMLAAVALRQLVRQRRPGGWWRLAGRQVVASLTLILLMTGARIGGWPPLSGQLPGPHLVSAYERSIDAPGVAGAQWLGRRLPPAQRVGADVVGWTLVSTYGRQDPVGEVAPLYYAPTWTPDVAQLRWDLGIQYLWVDRRLAQGTPVTGSYFFNDPQVGLHSSPISGALLDKFDAVPGTSRVYDNGTIRVYRMESR